MFESAASSTRTCCACSILPARLAATKVISSKRSPSSSARSRAKNSSTTSTRPSTTTGKAKQPRTPLARAAAVRRKCGFSVTSGQVAGRPSAAARPTRPAPGANTIPSVAVTKARAESRSVEGAMNHVRIVARTPSSLRRR